MTTGSELQVVKLVWCVRTVIEPDTEMTTDCSRLAPDALGLVFWLGGDRVSSHGEACRSAGEVLIGGVDIGRGAAVFVVSGENDALSLQRLCPTLFPSRRCLAIRFVLRHTHPRVLCRGARYITLRIRNRTRFVTLEALTELVRF